MGTNFSSSRSSETWQFLDDGRCRALQTMKRDLDLFEALRSGNIQGALRIYNWAEPALTCGFHQKNFTVHDTNLDIPVIQRPTGGGAVLHYDDFTFSICSKAAGALAGSISACSEIISYIFKGAFHGCGIEADMKGGNHAFSSICFARPAPSELVIGQDKIMGLALAKKGGFLLMQGVIPLRIDKELSVRVFGEGLQPLRKGILDCFPHFSDKLFFDYLRDGFISELGVLFDERRQSDHEYRCTDE
jgi:lipoate-protein ligase A